MCKFFNFCSRFNDRIYHYKLFFDPEAGLYVLEKKYDCVRSLVADGLVSMYLELKAPALLQRLCNASYQESPYMALNEKKLRVLSKGYESRLGRYVILYFRLFV